MSYLRCTHCGAKALSAASQCPRCTRVFDLHDASGMRVALRACRKCGFMHRIDRACTSCGELGPRVRMNGAWARGAAAAALALTVVGAAWQWVPSVVGADGRAGDARVPLVGSLPVAGALMKPAASGRLADGAVSGTGAPPGSEGRSALPASPESPALLPASSPGTAAAIATARRDSMAWVPAVARTWVNVRSDASRGGEVVGVIKPSSRAMLGSNRAGWRQVRSSDATGWVDPRLFAADSTRPRGE